MGGRKGTHTAILPPGEMPPMDPIAPEEAQVSLVTRLQIVWLQRVVSLSVGF